MIIGMDVDDVVADLIMEWLKRYRDRTNDILYPADIRSWDIWTYTKRMPRDRFYQILSEPDLYGYVKPCMGALPAINALKEAGHRIVYISSCVYNTHGPKRDWLECHGFMNRGEDALIAAHDKSLVTGVDILVDDRVENVERFPKKAVLIRKPHNEDLTCWRPRCHLKDLPEIIDYL